MTEESTELLNVFAVEDQPEFSNKIKEWIDSSVDFRFAGSASTLKEAYEKINQSAVDLLVLDMGLPDGSGSDLIAPLLVKNPDLKITAFTVFEDEKLLLKCIRNGAKGYILKDTPPELFLTELKVIALGGASLTMRMADRILKETDSSPELLSSPLTEREKQILNYMAIGYTSRNVADELGISNHTVRRHIEKIYTKLEVNSRSEAIQMGKRLGILDPNF